MNPNEFVETWMNAWNENPKTIVLNVSQEFGISASKVLAKAKLLTKAGVCLPGVSVERENIWDKVDPDEEEENEEEDEFDMENYDPNDDDADFFI